MSDLPLSAANPGAATIDLSKYPSKPTQLLSSKSGWAALGLGELKGRQELLVALASRDIRARYKQTILGVVWVVAQPLLAAGIFTFIFAVVAGIDPPEDGPPYFVGTFTALVLWNSTSFVLQRSGSSLVANAALVGKVYFPRLILPISSLLTVLVDFLVSAVLLIILIAIYWKSPGPYVLLAPILLGVSWLLALGIGLIVSAAGVIYRDALHMIPIVTQFLMWGSFVMIPITEVPEQYLDYVYLNPFVPLIESFRFAVLGEGTMPWGYFAYSVGFMIVSLLVGTLLFRRMERRFADVI
jgi:lipopolysaccharide transport system permease protein